MSEHAFERIVAGLGPADVSTLIALRALVSADDGVNAVERARWLTTVAEEYRRWYGPSAGQAPGNFPAGETVRYLNEHVVQALATGGAVEFLDAEGYAVPAPNGAGNWSAVRLAPWALDEAREHGKERLLDLMDARIRAILADRQPQAMDLLYRPLMDLHGRLEQELRDNPFLDLSERDVEAMAREEEKPEAAAVAEPPPEPRPHLGPELDHAPLADLHPEGEHAPARRRSMLVPGGLTLSAKGMVKAYRGRRVVNDVDVHVAQGEIVGLLGPNGAGKTTTFYMIVGLIRPDRGRVFVGEREVTRVAMFRRARRGIGYLAQEPSIFRKLTVEENVMAILQMMRIPKAERKRRLEVLLDELSIKHLRKTKAYALSGGERRRLEITRALVSEPKFMLLDEPFAGVDPIAVHDIQQIVSDLRRRGIGVLISDHNVEQTLDIVDRAYIMYEGRVRVSGTVGELVWNDEVAEIYLGPTLTARMRERYPNPREDEAV
ncbi:MAG TPA: LPS export ABC transporter ATP-binding protein [Longimicrobium sp.]